MNYTGVKEPAYGAADKSVINCLVKFEVFPEYVPFAAMATDHMEHGQKIYEELIEGKYGEIGPYVAPKLTPDDQYAAAIAAGISLASSSTPELNGLYGVSDSDVADITAEAQFVALYGEFTNDLTTFDWADAEGKPHTFPGTASFMQFAKAAARYLSACKQARNALVAGQSAAFPSNQVTIN